MASTAQQIKIARSFGAASNSYDISARLQRYCGKHLMPYLPQKSDIRVLDLGAGTGFFTDILASQYQEVLGVDMSKQMLNFAKHNRADNISWLAGNALNLPLQNQSVDLIYSNLMIQWCQPLTPVLNEIFRVLKPGGLFVFSTLLDGTLFELKSSWAQVDDDQHVIDFLSENALLSTLAIPQAKLLRENVQDIVLEYEDVLHLARELKGLGANQVPNKVNKGLAGKDSWQKMMTAYQDFIEPSGIYPATYKVFSGLMLKLSE